MQEQKRGCGFRKIHGVYLVGSGMSVSCDRLPILLEVCPTCNEGLKFSRNPRQIDAFKMFGVHGAVVQGFFEACPEAVSPEAIPESYCYVCRPPSDVPSYIMGVGERHYTPESFCKEALEMGVSKRVPNIPKNIVIGKSVVFLSHKKAIVHKTLKCPKCKSDKIADCPGSTNKEPLADINYICQDCLLEFEIPLIEETYQHGIFYAFKPQRIERIYWKSEDTPELREKLGKQGITPIFFTDGDKDHEASKKGKREDEDNEAELKALVPTENVITVVAESSKPILSSDWVHLLGIKNDKGVALTEDMLQAYETTSKRELECIFCSTIYLEGTKYCSRCKEYKGMQPYIEGWSEGND